MQFDYGNREIDVDLNHNYNNNNDIICIVYDQWTLLYLIYK